MLIIECTGPSPNGDSPVISALTVEAHENMSLLVLVFSSLGKVYSLKAHEIPEASLKARGKPIINLISFKQNEKIATFLPLPIDETTWNNNIVVFS